MTLSGLRTHGRRLAAGGLAVLLGTAFLTLTIALAASLGATLETIAAGTIGDADIVVTGAHGPVPAGDADRIRRAPGVTRADGRATTFVYADLGGRQAPTILESMPDTHALTVTDGRLPSGPDEVVATSTMTATRPTHVGDHLRLGVDRSGPWRSVTVVGVATARPGTLHQPGMPTALAALATIAHVTGRTDLDEVLVYGTASVDAVHALAPDLTVRTAAAEKQTRIDDLGGAIGSLTAVLSSFAAVALFVAALVIGNSFTMALAQRGRELALLRCIGATKRQVRRGILAESLVVGAIGSALGVVVGLLLARGAVALAGSGAIPLDRLVVTPLAVALPLLVGVGVTVVAAWAPTRRATRVAPIAALRPLAPESGRATRRRAVVGVVLFGLATVGLVAGAATGSAALAIPAGMVSFVGILVLGPAVVPAAVGLVGRSGLVGRGLPAELGVDNARRNPARAAACASALLVGVTLITLMSVGSASGTRSATAALDARVPVDLVVTAERSLTPEQVSRVAGTAGVHKASQATVVRDVTATPGDAMTVVALDPAHLEALRTPDALNGLTDDTVLVAADTHIAAGTPVRLVHGTHTVTRRAVVGHPPVGEAAVTPATASALGGGQTVALLRLTDDADPSVVTEAAGTALSGVPGTSVTGAAAERAQMQSVANLVLGIVTGLLAVAVVIALVGIGSTLSMAVLERTRELGLLRALGLTRRDVRRTVGLEALALSVAAVVIGLLLGIGYGIAGTYALLSSVGHITLDVPWLRLAVIALVAVGAGWAASALPARRAARTAPTVALATE